MKKKIILIIYFIICFILLCLSRINDAVRLYNVSLILLFIAIFYILYKLFRRYKGKVIIDEKIRTNKQTELKKVSVVIPNYNYAHYIEKRIDSVLNQTYPIYELIILDDLSKDNSVEVIEEKLKRIKKENKDIIVKFIKNEKNSGNVFKQWKKAFELSTGDYLWIAEADDLSDKHFLNVVMQGFINDEVIMSYSESKAIDEDENVINNDFRYWSDIFNIKLWNKNFVISGKKMLDKSLCINNSIVNASSVVFKKSSNIDVAKYLKQAQQYKLSGDWYFYSKYLLHGSIAYSTDSLNLHRVHKNSVTSNTDSLKKYDEIVAIQDSIKNDIKISFISKYYMKKFRNISK